MRTLLVMLLALVAVPAAGAVGPWLGTTPAGLGYTVVAQGETTVVSHDAEQLSLAGAWGLPLVTLGGTVGGVSADGRTLVLAEQRRATGTLWPATRFAVLAASPLALRRMVVLHGDFGFDALSPGGRTLYLVQHISQRSLFDYRVRAYDLRAGRLLPGGIADARQRGWVMNGFPVSRAAGAGGRWVYTLYANPDNYPFVHALDTVRRTAVCIGLPWDWRKDLQAIMSAPLRVSGDRLLVGARFAVDRSTLAVSPL
jgi:hypothetical protein